MTSTGMGKRLGVMALLLTVAGLAAPFPAADAAPLEIVTRAQFEAWFKEISNWGRWGKDDELGTLNLITAENRNAAAALVVFAKHVVHPERSEKNGVATHLFGSEEA